MLLAARSSHSAALSSLETLVGHGDAGTSLVSRAWCLHAMELFKRAVSAADDALRNHPSDDVPALCIKARSLAGLGKRKKALATLQAAFCSSALHRFDLLTLEQAAFDVLSLHGGRAALFLLPEPPPSGWAHHHRAAIAFVKGHISSAIRSLDAAIAECDGSANSTCELAMLYAGRSICFYRIDCFRHSLWDANQALYLDPSCQRAALCRTESLIATDKIKYRARAQSFLATNLLQTLRKEHECDIAIFVSAHAVYVQQQQQQHDPISLPPTAIEPSLVTHPAVVPADKEIQTNPCDTIAALRSRIAIATNILNSGDKERAIVLLSEVMADCVPKDALPANAFIARGTAYALSLQWEEAEADFSSALALDSFEYEAYKRRAQIKQTTGRLLDAVADLDLAQTALLPLWTSHGVGRTSPNAQFFDMYLMRSQLLNELLNYRRAAQDAAVLCEALCVSGAATPSPAEIATGYHCLGQALAGLGETEQAIDAFQNACRAQPGMYSWLVDEGSCHRERSDFKAAHACFSTAIAAYKPPNDLAYYARYIRGMHHRGILCHCAGRYKQGMVDFELVYETDSTQLEALFMLALCHHDLGQHRTALKYYETVMRGNNPAEHVGRVLPEYDLVQNLAFYQSEMAKWLCSVLDVALWCDSPPGSLTRQCRNRAACADRAVDPIFKEGWIKKIEPESILQQGYVLRAGEAEPSERCDVSEGSVQNLPAMRILCSRALVWGGRLQARAAGFLANQRQHRQVGMAVIDMSQWVVEVLASLQLSIGSFSPDEENLPPAPILGADGADSDGTLQIAAQLKVLLAAPDVYDGLHYGWRDCVNIAVKWRQLSEPLDTVFWVDGLPSLEFGKGYGSHTPLQLGHTKVGKYRTQHRPCFEQLKGLICARGGYTSLSSNTFVDLSRESRKLELIRCAADCYDLYSVIGEDFFAVTNCHSFCTPSLVLEGTRLSLSARQSPNLALTGTALWQAVGFDFSIRTPCTPDRWALYHDEMQCAWEGYCMVIVTQRGTVSGTFCDAIVCAVLKFCYYFYNFMPLTRGSAAIGHTTLMALLYAAGFELTSQPPINSLIDWQAILTPTLEEYQISMMTWLSPALRRVPDDEQASALPSVSQECSTMRNMIAALCLDLGSK